MSTLATDYGVPGAHHHHEEDAHDDDDDDHDHDHGHGAGGANAGTRIDLEQTRYDIDAGLDIGRFGIDRVRTRWGYADYTHDEVEASGEVGTRFNNEEMKVASN